jgi:uncharacterized protein with FMN-binding domain
VRRILLALMSTLAAVVLLFGYRTSTGRPVSAASPTVAAGTTDPTPSAGTATPAVPESSTPSATPSGGATTAPTPQATSGTTAVAKTVTGAAADTRWGPVQVQVTVTGGRLTAVTVLEAPAGNRRDVEINDVALPILKQETLQAQSARIDSVSGATYTSDGYVTSLQSALDQAGL